MDVIIEMTVAEEVASTLRTMRRAHTANDLNTLADLRDYSWDHIVAFEGYLSQPEATWEVEAEQAWRVLHRVAEDLAAGKPADEWANIQRELTAVFPTVALFTEEN